MADFDTLLLTHRPDGEANLDAWAAQTAAELGATVRESEQAADHYCWRLSINGRHWLMFYSYLCEAAWLQPLEGMDEHVVETLQARGDS